jgi:predicted Rdx family selenoprotein
VLNEQTAHDADAVPGRKSQFDVVADGALIFSKQREGRWPDEDEIIQALDGESAA